MAKQWVLVRGIMSGSFRWSSFLPQLQQCFPQDEFHTPDILGNGLYAARNTPLSRRKNIRALREQVPPRGKKILVGFSLGGMLALEWAHHHPEEIEAVILINCSLNNSPIFKRMTPYSLKQIVKSALHTEHLKREEAIIRLTTSEVPPNHIKEIAKDWVPQERQNPVRFINFFRQLFVAARIPQREKPPAPVLVLSSAKDKVVHPDCSLKISEVWNSPVVFHQYAGHDLTLEDPRWVVAQVNEFLRQAKATG